MDCRKQAHIIVHVFGNVTTRDFWGASTTRSGSISLSVFFRRTKRFSNTIRCIKRRSTDRRYRFFWRKTNTTKNDRELQVVLHGLVKTCSTMLGMSRINDHNVTILLCVESIFKHKCIISPVRYRGSVVSINKSTMGYIIKKNHCPTDDRKTHRAH